MNISDFVQRNNLAIDCLTAGEMEKASRLLSETFFRAIKDKHDHHALHARNPNASSLEYALQDCSIPLRRVLSRTRENSRSRNEEHGSDTHIFLSLNLLRIGASHMTDDQVDRLCTCSVSWVLGYNLSIVYALLGCQRAASTSISSASVYYFKRAARLLLPIKRQILLQTSNSAFWVNVKLCVLNNTICILKECGSSSSSFGNSTMSGSRDLACTIQSMEQLLHRSQKMLRPIDIKRFYMSVQFLNAGNGMAAAA